MSHTSICFVETDALPHAFEASVGVHGETERLAHFCTLNLAVSGTRIQILLPAHAYNAARSIADLWPTLADKVSATPKAFKITST